MGQQRNYNSDLKYADLDLVIERRVGFEPTVVNKFTQAIHLNRILSYETTIPPLQLSAINFQRAF